MEEPVNTIPTGLDDFDSGRQGEALLGASFRSMSISHEQIPFHSGVLFTAHNPPDGHDSTPTAQQALPRLSRPTVSGPPGTEPTAEEFLGSQPCHPSRLPKPLPSVSHLTSVFQAGDTFPVSVGEVSAMIQVAPLSHVTVFHYAFCLLFQLV